MVFMESWDQLSLRTRLQAAGSPTLCTPPTLPPYDWMRGSEKRLEERVGGQIRWPTGVKAPSECFTPSLLVLFPTLLCGAVEVDIVWSSFQSRQPPPGALAPKLVPCWLGQTAFCCVLHCTRALGTTYLMCASSPSAFSQSPRWVEHVAQSVRSTCRQDPGPKTPLPPP